MDGLTLKLSIGLTMLVVAPLLAGLWALERHTAASTLSAFRRAAELQNGVLEAALRHQMLTKDPALLTGILEEVGTHPEVSSAMILDREGVVRFSSRSALLGQRFNQASPTCLPCHGKASEERQLWVLLDEAGRRTLRSVLPIENRQECHQCHPAARRYNGMLVLDLSLAEVEARLRRETSWLLAATTIVSACVLGGVGLLIRRLILVRLSRLGRAARAIAAGNLSRRAPVEGDDRIRSLAEDFNAMADAITQLVTEVQEREKRMANVIDSLDDGLVVLDAELCVIAANHSFGRRCGFHPEVLPGRRCADIRDGLSCCDDDHPCPAARCLRLGETQRDVFRRPGGNCLPELVEEVVASPVFDGEGRVAHVVEIWRDISERVKEEERLAEIERLSSLGALASGFCHEVNTPLASVLTCAESVLGRLDEPSAAEDLPAIRDSAQTIKDEVMRCRRITEQFLRFARGIPPSIELLDLREVVASVVALAAPTARQTGVTLRVEGDFSLPAVAANTEVVQHVVINLLVNAIQSFQEHGGSITIGFAADDDVRVTIEDDGSGIPAEWQKDLFEPFRTHKPHGTGLGLFLSRGFMRRFGGDVRLVRSSAGRGSCFEVVFRRADAEAA